MGTPYVSVLMPVYNAGRYVAEAVESVLAQTYIDFECLILDDGSTDGSRAILERYAARDDRIRLISRPNSGVVIALNEMIAQARGRLLARMDADDVSLPDRFARQVAFLREHPEVVCVGGAFQLIDPEGRLLLSRVDVATDDAAIQQKALRGRTPLAHPTVMMRREALLAVGGYRVEFELAEDLDLWLRLGERGRLANLSDVVLKYREHEASISQRRHAVQLERTRQAAEEALDRRGIPRSEFTLTAHRPGSDQVSLHRYALRNGWWAFGSGERRTALHYGLRAVGLRPYAAAGWRLLACALLKPARRPG